VKQKLAHAGHATRGPCGINAVLVLEEKFDGKKSGRSRRTLADDIIQWRQKKASLRDSLRTGTCGEI